MSAAGPTRNEGPDWVRRRGGVDAPLVVPSLPAELPFGFLGGVLPPSAPAEFRLFAERIPSPRALELLDRAGAAAETELAHPGNEASRTALLERELESVRDLARGVAGRTQELWRVGMSFHGRGATPRGAERAREEIVRRLSRLGFGTRSPTYQARETVRPPDPTTSAEPPPGFFHTLPTDGLAAFFPFIEETVQEPGGILAGLLLDDASPVLLNRWSEASHSWALFGTTGAGKSFSAALWMMRSRWLDPSVELYVVDPLGEFGPLARTLGGAVVSLGSGGGERLNPLDLGVPGESPEPRAARVGTMLRALFPSLRDEELALLDAAVSRLCSREGGPPTWSDLWDIVRADPRPGRLVALLEVLRTGSLAYTNGPTTASLGSNPLVLDLSGTKEEHLPFALTYALSALDARIRRSRTRKLLIVDEAHFLVRHPATAEFLDQLVRHARHFATGLLLLSQNPEDFLVHAAGRSMLRNLRATFLLRLPSVSEEARRFFDLTPAEVDWLPRARLPREAGYAEGLLRFGDAHLPLAIVVSTPEFEFLAPLLSPAPPPPPLPPTSRTSRL